MIKNSYNSLKKLIFIDLCNLTNNLVLSLVGETVTADPVKVILVQSTHEYKLISTSE